MTFEFIPLKQIVLVANTATPTAIDIPTNIKGFAASHALQMKIAPTEDVVLKLGIKNDASTTSTAGVYEDFNVRYAKNSIEVSQVSRGNDSVTPTLISGMSETSNGNIYITFGYYAKS